MDRGPCPRLRGAGAFAITAVLLLAAAGDAWSATAAPTAATPWQALDLPSPLEHLLATGRWDKTPVHFRIVALSFLADACVARARQAPSLRQAAVACVARSLELALATRPRALKLEQASQGLWLSHFHLILGARDALGPCPDAKLHASIAHALAQRSLREPTAHMPSYPGKPQRWPADQTATLASLSRYDRYHGTHLAEEPLRRWRDHVLAKTMDEKLGLPWSEVTGRARFAREPRGSALAWQTRFLREIDPRLAATWWRAFKAHYLVDTPAGTGFREWPPGREHRADADSGPIVAGVGAAATALAIAAARVMDDQPLAARLQATAHGVKRTAHAAPALARAAETILASAILYLGEHATAK